uniref:ABC-three component system middle component 6 n=1 Tax=Anaerobutyricum hallii TaxID=39488 RepID=UPI003FF0C5D5
MILPKKQLSMEESLFGFGGFLLEKLSVPMTVDELWKDYKKDYDSNGYAVKFSFDQYIMTLDYLYIIGAIRRDERGLLCYEAA